MASLSTPASSYLKNIDLSDSSRLITKLCEATCILDVLRQWSQQVPGDDTCDTFFIPRLSSLAEQLVNISNLADQIQSLVPHDTEPHDTRLRAWQADLQTLSNEMENIILFLADHCSFGSNSDLIFLAKQALVAMHEATDCLRELKLEHEHFDGRRHLELTEELNGVSGVDSLDCPELEIDEDEGRFASRAASSAEDVFQSSGQETPELSSAELSRESSFSPEYERPDGVEGDKSGVKERSLRDLGKHRRVYDDTGNARDHPGTRMAMENLQTQFYTYRNHDRRVLLEMMERNEEVLRLIR